MPEKGLEITVRPLDGQRLLVGDIVRLSRHVPIFPVERMMELAEVERLRKGARQRIGWAALFMKAYGLVARERPALRSWFLPWRIFRPFRRPAWATSPESVASLAISRPRPPETPADLLALDPEAIYWARIRSPDARPLPELQAEILRYSTAPLEEVFARQLQLQRVPRLLRRIILRWNANRMHPTFLTTSLTYTPLDDLGRMNVTLLADHRLLDGVPVARALAALEETLRGPIAEELSGLE